MTRMLQFAIVTVFSFCLCGVTRAQGDEGGISAKIVLLAPAKSAGENRYESPAGERVLARVTLTNTGQQPVALRASDVIPHARDFMIVGPSGEALQVTTEVHRRSRDGAATVVKPAESIDFDADLTSLYPPAIAAARGKDALNLPGTYKISYESRIVPQDGLWSGSIKSPSVELIIAPLPPDQRKAIWEKYAKATDQERVGLAALLARSMGKDWDPAMMQLLKDTSPLIRCVTVMAMANLPATATDAIDHLRALLEKDPDPVVQSAAALALGRIGDRGSVPILIAVVQRRQERSYREAVRSLGLLKDPRAVPVLEDVARNDPEAWVREAAARSLQQIRPGTTAPATAPQAPFPASTTLPAPNAASSETAQRVATAHPSTRPNGPLTRPAHVVAPEDRGEDFSPKPVDELLSVLGESQDIVARRKAAKVLGDRELAGSLRLSDEQRTSLERYIEESLLVDVASGYGL